MNTVFFDLGNVLIFFDLEKMYRQLATCLSVSVHALREYLLREKLAEQYERGQVTSQDVYQAMQKIAAVPFSLQEMRHAMSHIFTPNTALWPLVEQLHLRGTHLVLLSNTNECHFQFAYATFPILKLFDRFLLSYQLGACKPQAEVFRHALREVRGTRSFYTDDVPAFIEAGRSAGLDAEVFLDVPTLHRQLQERDLL
jgi:glucose-1-phosphatase